MDFNNNKIQVADKYAKVAIGRKKRVQSTLMSCNSLSLSAPLLL